MNSYYAYGLGIESSVPLPELVQLGDGGVVDVYIRRGKVDSWPNRTTERDIDLKADPQEIYLYWKGVATFLVRDGHEVIFDPAPGVEDQVIRLFILGRVLASLLHQRGLLVLHASAVEVNGGAIAFLGGKGWGKSTLAATMHRHGHPVVTDDVVALNVSDVGVPVVYPGFPQVKLWPEAAAFLGDSVDELPRLHPQFEKRARPVARGFSPSSLPLKGVYVLDEGAEPEITTLSDKEAFLEVVRHSYATNLLEPTHASALHFRQCERVIKSVPVNLLKKRSSLGALPELVGLIERDFLSRNEAKTELDDVNIVSAGR
jgi:hypothetical protein